MSDLRDKLVGPVIPLPTAFTVDDEVDVASMSSYSQWLVDRGIGSVMTTVGTSRYNLLMPEEIRAVNEAVVAGVKASSRDAISIVANPPYGGVKQAVEFALHAQSIGADVFLAYFPERHYGEENTFAYFEALSASVDDISILIHEMPMRNGFGGDPEPYSLDLIEKLLGLKNVIGMKEEALNPPYSNQIVERFSAEAVIIGAGGGMSRYLNRDHERGAKAFLGGIGGFVPELELEFFEALQRGDQARAKAIVEEVEKPYFDVVVPMGWHPSLKGALSIKGLMGRHERQPMRQMPESDYQLIEVFMEKQGWLS